MFAGMMDTAPSSRSFLAQLAARELESSSPPSLPVDEHWEPNKGPQTQFWETDCREVLFGGAAGGGKSAALTALPLKWAHIPGFLSLTLRREATQLKDLTAKARELYAKVVPGIRPVKSPRWQYNLPGGVELCYGHCKNSDDYADYDGWEINLLNFDELTHFTETQYKAICARVRTSNPKLPTLVRATTNPGGVGHDWVFRRWGAWLDPEFEAEGLPERWARGGLDGPEDDSDERVPPALPGEIWWVRTDAGVETYYREDPGLKDNPALSRTFIPSRLSDNPHLANDGEYRAQLQQLDPVRRLQLDNGDWLVKPAAGLYFKRQWVTLAPPGEPLPRFVKTVRAWDLAATEADGSNNPDWTAAPGMGLTAEGDLWIFDMARGRHDPGDVKALVKSTAELDGRGVVIRLPQDPGQAGKSQAIDFARMLAGYMLVIERPSGSKETRFGPFSAFAKNTRSVYVVNGPWAKAMIEELEAFPTKGVNDDQVDAIADGFDTLMNKFPANSAPIRIGSRRHRAAR